MYQVAYYLKRNASMLPNNVALRCGDDALTWRELEDYVDVVASSLFAYGVGRGDVVAYHLSNRIELIAVWWACQKIGAAALPLNVRLRAEELIGQLNLVECKMLFYEACTPEDVSKFIEMRDFLESVESVVSVGSEIKKSVTWNEFFGHWCADEEKEAVNALEDSICETDASMILFTSGTTGIPKAVLRTQRMVRDYMAMSVMENHGGECREVIMTPCPLFHIAGMSSVLKAAALGGEFVLLKKFDEEVILNAVDRYRVTQMMIIPPILYTRFVEFTRRCAGGGARLKACARHNAREGLYPWRT